MMRCEELAIELDMVSPECAAQVVHHFDSSAGYPAGSFIQNIISAFDAADPRNRRLLGRSFPEYRLAMHLAKDHELGMDTLRAIAQKEHA